MVKNCALDPAVNIPISGIGGIETWRDAVEHMLLGARNVQVCTAVMHYGFRIIKELTAGLEQYMREKNMQSLDDLIGKSLDKVRNWEELNLHYKVVAEINADKCIQCQLCYIACEDGAHQAIGLSQNGSRIPHIIEENCVGCNLCSYVCPVDGCITMVRRDDGSKHEDWKDYLAADKAPTTFNDQRGGGVGHHIPEPVEALSKKPRSVR
jgi:dihydropyrimidine dehydrogenase (NAD+) subunit PreA